MKSLVQGLAWPVLTLIGAIYAQISIAHSLEGVEESLRQEEQYAQLVNYPAPPFELIDLAGTPWNLSGQAGKTLIVNFVYARCQDICPIHMVLISKLQQMVNEAQMQEQVQFITIATDTEEARETAEVMRTYQDIYDLDPVNWIFLYGGADDPGAGKRIAGEYGLQFTETEDGAQMHGAVTHLIDREGQMRARFHGLNFKPVSLVGYANTLVYDFHADSDHHGVAEESDTHGGISWVRLLVVVLGLIGVLVVAYLVLKRMFFTKR